MAQISSKIRVKLSTQKYLPSGLGNVDEMPELDLFVSIFGATLYSTGL